VRPCEAAVRGVTAKEAERKLVKAGRQETRQLAAASQGRSVHGAHRRAAQDEEDDEDEDDDEDE
jgi:hypothetical protein